jgi:hypothetical protein
MRRRPARPAKPDASHLDELDQLCGFTDGAPDQQGAATLLKFVARCGDGAVAAAIHERQLREIEDDDWFGGLGARAKHDCAPRTVQLADDPYFSDVSDDVDVLVHLATNGWVARGNAFGRIDVIAFAHRRRAASSRKEQPDPGSHRNLRFVRWAFVYSAPSESTRVQSPGCPRV